MPVPERRSFWQHVRGLAPPTLVLGSLVAALVFALSAQVRSSSQADEDAVREWLSEARPFHKTLPELVREYLELRRAPAPKSAAEQREHQQELNWKAEEIGQQLKALGIPSRKHREQLLLFPTIYSLAVVLDEGQPASIRWDSHLQPPHRPGEEETSFRKSFYPDGEDAGWHLDLEYQLHSYNRRQEQEERQRDLNLKLSILAAVAALVGAIWVYFFFKRERERHAAQYLAQHQVDQAERLLLQEELRRQEAEHLREEAERKALELKSQVYAGMSILAGSYAHNIKNLLVRPNDLLARCLEADGLPSNQQQMLNEVRGTLGTVTERLQLILRTVQRDPTQPELVRLDLAGLVRDLEKTWRAVAADRWKMLLSVEAPPMPLWIEGDYSHLQQAVENLLFNARDATFEMRAQLSQQARADGSGSVHDRKQAVLAAAAWRGQVVLRAVRDGAAAVLEVGDNGAGMTEEVRQRCTEAHFSTKRNNALFEGYNAGMGLGLSFVAATIENHKAKLEIESRLKQGTTMRVRFVAARQNERVQE